jgi:hypothetical protein
MLVTSFFVAVLYSPFKLNAEETIIKINTSESLLPDSNYVYQWDIMTNSWLLSSKNIYQYQNNKIESTINYALVRELNIWKKMTRIDYSYGKDGELIEKTDYNWTDEFNRWDSNSRVFYTYDTSGRQLEILVHKWNLNISDWQNYLKYINYYDNEYDWSEQILLSWDNTNKEWINYYRYLREFINTKPKNKLMYDWDNLIKTWINYKLFNYGYKKDTLLTDITEYDWARSSSQWYCFRYTQTSYDDDNKVISEESSTCRSPQRYLGKFDYIYDSTGRKIEKIEYRWDNSNSIWILYHREFYFFKDGPTSVSAISDNIYIYPNPASDYIDISAGKVIQSDAKGPYIRIYDVLGMGITTPLQRATPAYQGGEILRIDISGLSSGVYFVKIGDVVRKFVKL